MKDGGAPLSARSFSS